MSVIAGSLSLAILWSLHLWRVETGSYRPQSDDGSANHSTLVIKMETSKYQMIVPMAQYRFSTTHALLVVEGRGKDNWHWQTVEPSHFMPQSAGQHGAWYPWHWLKTNYFCAILGLERATWRQPQYQERIHCPQTKLELQNVARNFVQA